MYRLLESIRVENGAAGNVQLHQQRVNASCQELFGKLPSWQIAGVLAELKLPVEGLHKLRIGYDADRAECTVTPYTIRPVSSLKLVNDDVGVDYRHKFEDRRKLDILFDRREDKDDILIVQNGMVTDTSYANIVLSSKGKWYTPQHCLLDGVMRQRLISKGAVEPVRIGVDDVKAFEQFRLINALLRFEAMSSDVSNIS